MSIDGSIGELRQEVEYLRKQAADFCDMYEREDKKAADEIERLTETLKSAREYFDQRADADQPSGAATIANEEMLLLMEIDEVLR